MSKREALFQRVKESAGSLDQLLRAPSNVPVTDYLDAAALEGLVAALGFGPNEWRPEDLETVLIIRDGFYDMRQVARDRNDDSEHSLEQILSALDRLYADLDRLLKEPTITEIEEARQSIDKAHGGASLRSAVFAGVLKDLDSQAVEVIVKAANTFRRTDVLLTKIGTGAAEGILKQIKLSVRRLSASVFALKISMERSTIYEGVFSFLHDRSDSIIAGIKALAQGLNDVYATSSEFLAKLRDLTTTSERFTQRIKEFLDKAFADLIEPETSVRFRVQSYEVREAVYCAGEASDGLVLLAGKRGSVQLADATRARSERIAKMTQSDVLSVVQLDRGEYALGTVRGLHIARSGLSLEGDPYVVEHVTAVALMPTWGNEGVLVTGSREGMLRQFTLADVHRGRPAPARDSRRKGIRIAKLLPQGSMLWMAAGQELILLEPGFKEKAKLTVPFQINDMCLHLDGSLLACGTGAIAHITDERGFLARSLTSVGDAQYTAIAPLAKDVVCTATRDGVLSALDLNSNEELGSLMLGFSISGMMKAENKLIAFGGDGHEGKAIAYVLYDQITELPNQVS